MTSRRHVVRFGFALAFAGLTLGATPVAAQEKPSFYIFGLIKNPGAYHLKSNTTVGDAIDIAGGFTNRSVSGIDIVRIVNGEKETVTVSLNDAVMAGDTVVVKG